MNTNPNSKPNTDPNQPPANERDELARLLPELADRDLPSDRQRHIEEFVMSQIQSDQRPAEREPRRIPRRRLALATSGLAAVAVAAVAIGTVGFGGSDNGGPAAAGPNAGTTASPAARTNIELAAAYAAAQPFTAPRPDQWIYVETRVLSPGAVAKDKGQNPDLTDQLWTRADGKKMGMINPNSGQLNTWDQDSEYPALCALPTDPQQLLTALRTEMETEPTAAAGGPKPPHAMGTTTPEGLNQALFSRIAGILEQNLLPPAVTAALWQATALIPGVTESPDPVDVNGRQLTAIGQVQDGWRFEQLLLDPDTHEFVAWQAVAVADHTETGGPNGPIVIKKGEVQYAMARISSTIVDAAGQTS